MRIINKLIHAIETANDLDFETAFQKQMSEGNHNDPTSAYLIDKDGNRQLWLNFGFPAKDLTLDIVNAIAPAFLKAGIQQVNFPGESKESDFETPAFRKLMELVNQNDIINKLNHAIETANDLDFDTAFQRQMSEGNLDDPTSAYLLDTNGNRHLWLNFGFPAKELTLDMVKAIAPALQKAKIESFSFPGKSTESDFETPAYQKLMKLA